LLNWLISIKNKYLLYSFFWGYILGLRILIMPYCVDRGCKRNYMVDKSISFFGFPKDQQILKIWVHYCKRQYFSPSKHSITCSKDFTERQYSRNPARLAPFLDSAVGWQLWQQILIQCTHVEVVLVQNTVVHVNSGNENDHLGNRSKRPHFLPKRQHFLSE
jgi:hypothetical protein